VAEREFWRFFEQNPSVGFDAAAILPGMIFGPPSEYPSANGEITSTVQFILPFAKPGVPDAALSSQFFNAVNVGDGE
jgi:hypothetical protein